MMCSIEELGSSRDYYPKAPENGIYVFDDDVEVGADVYKRQPLLYNLAELQNDCSKMFKISPDRCV